MFKRILITVALVVTAIPLSAKEYFYSGSEWYRDTWTKVHTEYYAGGVVSVMRSTESNKGYKYDLVLDGKINYDLLFRLQRMIEEIKPLNHYVTNFYLHSLGGNARAGMDIADLLRDNNIQTVVTGDQECWSACVDVFIGGSYRSIRKEGKLIAHTAYITGNFGTTECVTADHSFGKETLSWVQNKLSPDAVEKYKQLTFKCDVEGGITLNAHNSKWLTDSWYTKPVINKPKITKPKVEPKITTTVKPSVPAKPKVTPSKPKEWKCLPAMARLTTPIHITINNNKMSLKAHGIKVKSIVDNTAYIRTTRSHNGYGNFKATMTFYESNKVSTLNITITGAGSSGSKLVQCNQIK